MKRKMLKRFAAVLTAIMALALTLTGCASKEIGIIGGADGSTEVFISGYAHAVNTMVTLTMDTAFDVKSVTASVLRADNGDLLCTQSCSNGDNAFFKRGELIFFPLVPSDLDHETAATLTDQEAFRAWNAGEDTSYDYTQPYSVVIEFTLEAAEGTVVSAGRTPAVQLILGDNIKFTVSGESADALTLSNESGEVLAVTGTPAEAAPSEG